MKVKVLLLSKAGALLTLAVDFLDEASFSNTLGELFKKVVGPELSLFTIFRCRVRIRIETFAATFCGEDTIMTCQSLVELSGTRAEDGRLVGIL